LLSVAVSAQDSKAKSKTNIKADDARVMSMTGCLRQDPVTSAYLLEGTTAVAGDNVTTKSRVKTDVDRKGTTVKGESRTTGDHGAVATGGALATYALLPGDNVSLDSHVGEQVQISAIAVK